MRVHLLSDLHTEFRRYTYTPPPGGCDVVVLAGDIGYPSGQHVGAMRNVLIMAARHAPVVYVPGNHDRYGQGSDRAFAQAVQRIADDISVFTEHPVHVLDEGRAVRIGGVLFAGATLWSDLSLGGDFAANIRAARGIDDMIGPPWSMEMMVEAHRYHRNALDRAHGQADAAALPLVIVTHFLPAPGSLDPRFAGHNLNPYFCTDMTREIERWGRRRLRLWLHGHTHACRDYVVAGVRVVCNPRGYPGEATGYDKHLVVEVPGTEGAGR